MNRVRWREQEKSELARCIGAGEHRTASSRTNYSHRDFDALAHYLNETFHAKELAQGHPVRTSSSVESMANALRITIPTYRSRTG